MNRGDIYFADLDPTIGDETKKIRPVLIVSNNANNKIANTLTIVPITSNTNKVFPFEVLLDSKETGLTKTSKAQCHQIRTISKNRISYKQIQGHVPSKLMIKINAAIVLHLDLNT